MLNRAQDWNISLKMPPERGKEFADNILLGIVSMQIFNEYTNVLIFAQSKSGSFHTLLLLQLALGLTPHPVGFNATNDDLYYPRVLASKLLDKNTISKSHVPNSLAVSRMVRNLDMRSLVLTRCLLDSLVSRRDHVFNTNPGQDLYSEKEYNKFLRGSSEYQLDVTIEKFAARIIEFFISWEAYSGEVVRITYEDIISDPVDIVNKVANELGLEVIRDVEEIITLIKDSGGANLNKGIVGRGKELFNERQIEEVMRKADILGCTDELFLRI